MNFITLQKTVRDAIAASTAFSAQAATNVLVDNGDVKTEIETAFLSDSGYSIAVWPATKGSANRDEDYSQGVMASILVRLQINPQKLKAIKAANQSENEFINTSVAAIVVAVLGIDPGPSNLRFQLEADAFELISFDEGMIAYHIRFTRQVVFGT